tara:strand:+ start:47766 stop:47966 length:201 start_codon:yes stop_codon:yes gene_type:complete
MTPKHFETDAIRQQLDRTNYGEHSTPLFLTSSFVFAKNVSRTDQLAHTTKQKNPVKLTSQDFLIVY